MDTTPAAFITSARVSNANALDSWVSNVKSQFAWVGNTNEPLGLRKLKTVAFHLYKKPSFKGYLRTLEYHPPQEGMLPACIWAEVDIDAVRKNLGECKIDLIRERNAIDHVLFYKHDNTALREYIQDFEQRELSPAEYSTSEDIGKYVLRNNIPYYEFIDYLQTRTPKVYILPIDNEVSTDDENATQLDDVFFFGDEDNAPIRIDHYPAYPLNSCQIGTEDIQFNLMQAINDGLLRKATNHSFIYETTDQLDLEADRINLTYKYSVITSIE